MNNLSLIPIWKGGDTLTAADRLHELALLAQTKPEKFDRFVLVRVGNLSNGCSDFDHWQFGCDLCQQIGLFDIGKHLALKDSEA